MTNSLRLILLLLLWIFIYPSLAAEKQCPSEALDLLPYIEIMEDPGRTLTIEQVSNSYWSNRFRKNIDGQSNFGFSKSAFWIRINYQAPVDCGRDWLLVIAWSRLDSIELFRHVNPGWQQVTTGDTYPYASREVDHHHFVFHLPDLSADYPPYYLRVASIDPVWLPMTLWLSDSFTRHTMTELLIYGLYFGMLSGLILYNLIVYLSVKDAAYLYYLAYLVSLIMIVMVITGMSSRFLWPESPQWDNLCQWVFPMSGGAAFLEFTRRILDIPLLAPRINRVMQWGTTWALCVLLAMSVVDYDIISRLAPISLICGFLIIMYAIYFSFRMGNSLALYVGAAFFFIFVGYIFAVMMYLNLTPYVGEWVLYLTPTAGLLEAILLSMALGERIKQMQQQKLMAQNSLLQAQQRFSRQLIATQDIERKRVASELHDGIGQNLLVINNRLNRLNNQGTQSILPEKLSFLADVAQQTIHDVRAISHQLHPHQLDRLGLTTAISTMADDTLSSVGINISCQIDNIDACVNKDQALHLYRIVQEAVKNVIQHSDAGAVSITLNRDQGQLYLKIIDNGCGIDTIWFNQRDYSQAFGLSSLHERVTILQGSIALSNMQPKGLQLAICIPITQKITDDKDHPDRR